MTTTWRDLPLEILLQIFSHIHYFSDFAECRLVCKAWDAPAERAWFSGGFNLGIIRQMKGICHHLTKKPALAKTLKYVIVSDVEVEKDLPLVKEMLPLFLHRNLPNITGTHCHPAIIAMIHEHLQNALVKLENLKRLPNPRQYDETYGQLIYAHRHTLEHVDIGYTRGQNSPTMDNIFARLHEFKKVVEIKIVKNHFLNLEDLDNLLQRIPESCKSMDIELAFAASFSTSRTERAMTYWLQHRVNKISNLTKLRIDCNSRKCFDNMIEYFTFKYPELDSIDVNGITLNEEIFQRTTAPLTRIPAVDLERSYYDGSEIPVKLIRAFKTTNNRLNLRYEDPHEALEASVSRDLTKGICDLQMTLDGNLTDAAYLDLLSNLDSTSVASLTVDLFHNKSLYPNHDTITQPSFLDIVRTVPQVEDLRFTESHIPNLEPGSLILENLKKLQFSCANIGSSVLSAISKMSPHLESLKLESCLVLNATSEFDGTTRLQLPCNSIATLSISLIDSEYMIRTSENPTFVHYRSMFEHLKVKHSAFVRLTTTEVQHIMLLRETPPMLITKEEFAEYSKGRPIYDIECKSLSLLEFDIKTFKMKLQFKDGKLENGCKSEIMRLEEHWAEINKRLRTSDTAESSQAEIGKSVESGMFVGKVKRDYEDLRKRFISYQATELRQDELEEPSDIEESDYEF